MQACKCMCQVVNLELRRYAYLTTAIFTIHNVTPSRQTYSQVLPRQPVTNSYQKNHLPTILQHVKSPRCIFKPFVLILGEEEEEAPPSIIQ